MPLTVNTTWRPPDKVAVNSIKHTRPGIGIDAGPSQFDHRRRSHAHPLNNQITPLNKTINSAPSRTGPMRSADREVGRNIKHQGGNQPCHSQ